MFPTMSHSLARVVFALAVLLSSVTSFLSFSVHPSSRTSSSSSFLIMNMQPVSPIDSARQLLRAQTGRVAFVAAAMLTAAIPSPVLAVGSGGLTEANEKLGHF